VNSTVSDYINTFAEPLKSRLLELRSLILSIQPDAVESFAYGMPAYKYKGKPLAYFAGYPNHIGFYATPNSHSEFKSDLKGYKQGKGSVQFPNSEPLPLDLIGRMVEFRASSI
jgi:uncharacterized protein YdhG (YjbR/CyaY superfamily)